MFSERFEAQNAPHAYATCESGLIEKSGMLQVVAGEQASTDLAHRSKQRGRARGVTNEKWLMLLVNLVPLLRIILLREHAGNDLAITR